MKRPLVVLTLVYGLGIICSELIRINFEMMLILGVLILIAAGVWQKRKYLFLSLMLCLVFLIGCLSLKNFYRLPKCHLNNFINYQDQALYSLSGFIASQPEIKNSQQSFIFRAQEVGVDKLKWSCCGKLLIKMDFLQELNYGDKLILVGKLKRPYNFNNTSFSYRDFLKRQGIYLIMQIQDCRQIIRQEGNSGLQLLRFSFWLRARMESVISQYLPELPAAIVSAMVLGQKQAIPWLVNNSMVRSGTVHILVVSGFNVAIVVLIINLLFKIMRIPKLVRIIMVIICLLIYCLLTGASNPVIRATIMGIIFIAAYCLKRDSDIYNSLAGAALFILALNPTQLFDIGFQLSFVSVLAIIYLNPKLKAALHLDHCKNKAGKFIVEGLLVSFSAWLGTLVIIALNFRLIAPVTVLANILIVPLATLITLSGFTLVLVGLIYPALASLFSAPICLLVTLLLNINQAVIRVPGAYFYL